MRNRAAVAALLSLLMLVAALPASAGPGVTIGVKTSAKTEFLPAPGESVTHGYFAWSSPVKGRSHVFVQVDGGAKTQIDGKTWGFNGAFAAGEDRLIYQRISFPGGDAQSDLRMWDGITGDTSGFVNSINNDQWQWGPSYGIDDSDNMWLLYGENRFNGPKAPWKVILFDGSTNKKQVLAETTYRCGCIQTGTFAYPWVSWSKGPDGTVWRMNVETDVKEKLTVPGNRDEHSIGVSADGTAYVAQDGAACGTHGKIFRIDPDGPATLVTSLPAGTEAYTLAPFDTGTGIDVYFDRYKCSTKRYDIYVIRDAEAVARTAPVHLGSGPVAPAGSRRMPVGAVPPR